ncbi:hypothetical protein GCM10023086_49910 [Streptomyces venetus]|uniref:Uncharacterized protein n=1 Tax=Streptomyces venetus TaxID=1701086 RepID=A0ABP8GGR3_9ACTN
MRSLTLHTTATAAGSLAAVASLLTAPPAAAAPEQPVMIAVMAAPQRLPAPPSASAPDGTGPRDAGTPQNTGFGWWPYALASALAVSLAIPMATRHDHHPRRPAARTESEP